MMNEIWSDNRYMNMAVNILLFLVGINFMHIGQLILPVICFLLFIDNRLRFKVNDPKIFILLCLFAVSFYAFSYQLGFYSVMGFTCPMAYYIGSNIRHPSEENMKKVIYLLITAMGIHIVLNAIAELQLHGVNGFFFSSSHYDFWTRQKISNTGTAINGTLMIGALYHVLIKEKDRRFRIYFLILFVTGLFYLIVIGRRTPLLMMAVVFVALYLYESRVIRDMSAKLKKTLIISFLCTVILIAAIFICYRYDIFSCRGFLDRFRIIMKFKQGLIGDERFRLLIGAIRLMPKYPFGGQKISAVLGLWVHEFWIDIYDYAGIVPFILMVAYSLLYLRTMIRSIRKDRLSADIKTLLLGIYICIVIQMYLEPVMTGASLFLLVVIIIGAVIERTIHE